MPQDANPISGDAAVIARRYARALYELAQERNQLDAVAADLRTLKELVRENAEFRGLMDNPRCARARLAKAMQRIAETAKFNDMTGNFLALAAQNRRLPQLNAVIDAFLARLAAARGEFTAEVQSAQALSPDQQEKLAAQLQKIAGGKVHVRIREDKSLLGGLVVKLGSRLIDVSVEGRLARLERQLKSQAPETFKGAA